MANARTRPGSWRDRAFRAAWMAEGESLLPFMQGQDRIYGAPGEAPAYDLQLPPRGRAPGSVENRTWYRQGEPIPLLGRDTFYGGQGQAIAFDWQLPPRGRPAGAIENRTWMDAGEPTPLLGKDTIYGGQGQAPVYEWLVPKGYRRGIELLGFVDQHQTNTFSTQPPTFYGAMGQAVTYDWQLWPRGRPPGNVENRWFTDQGEPLPLQGQDTFFGAPGERVTYDPTLLQSLKRRLTVDDVLNLLGTTLSAEAPIPPGENVNDAAPRAKGRTAQDWFTALVTTTLSAPAPLPPGANVNDLAPPAKGRSRELLSFADGPLNVLLGQDTLYGAPGEAIAYDWQLPTPARRRGRDLLTDTNPLRILIGQDRFYGAPGQSVTYDWQLPTPARLRGIILRVFTAWAPIDFIPPPPTTFPTGAYRVDALRYGATPEDDLAPAGGTPTDNLTRLGATSGEVPTS